MIAGRNDAVVERQIRGRGARRLADVQIDAVIRHARDRGIRDGDVRGAGRIGLLEDHAVGARAAAVDFDVGDVHVADIGAVDAVHERADDRQIGDVGIAIEIEDVARRRAQRDRARTRREVMREDRNRVVGAANLERAGAGERLPAFDRRSLRVDIAAARVGQHDKGVCAVPTARGGVLDRRLIGIAAGARTAALFGIINRIGRLRGERRVINDDRLGLVELPLSQDVVAAAHRIGHAAVQIVQRLRAGTRRIVQRDAQRRADIFRGMIDLVVRELPLDRQARLRPQHVEVEDVHFRTQLRTFYVAIGEAEIRADAGGVHIGVVECVSAREDAHIRIVRVEHAIADLAVEAGQRRFLALQDRDGRIVDIELELVRDGAVRLLGEIGVGADIPIRGHRFDAERNLIEGMVVIGLRAVEARKCAQYPFAVDLGAVAGANVEIVVAVVARGCGRAEAHEQQRIEVLPNRHECIGAADRKAASGATADIDIGKPFRRIDWRHRWGGRCCRRGNGCRCGRCIFRERRRIRRKSGRTHRRCGHARRTDKKLRLHVLTLANGVAHASPNPKKASVSLRNPSHQHNPVIFHQPSQTRNGGTAQRSFRKSVWRESVSRAARYAGSPACARRIASAAARSPQKGRCSAGRLPSEFWGRRSSTPPRA